MRIYDKREEELPNIGLIKVKDAETGQYRWIDTGNEMARLQYAVKAKENEGRLKEMFNKGGVDTANINTNDSYIKPLMNLFKKRESR